MPKTVVARVVKTRWVPFRSRRLILWSAFQVARLCWGVTGKFLRPAELLLLCTALMYALGPELHPVAAQLATGTLTGKVTDLSGTAIAGVNITLSDSATGETRTTITDATGDYRFSLLRPDSYGATFSSAGFKKAQAAINISVSEEQFLDARLDQGSSDSIVTCNCVTGVVSSSSTGVSVNKKAITAAPLTTRNFTQILSMASGSAAAVNNAAVLGPGTQSVNVNGSSNSSGFTVDGAYAGNTVPNPDTISEFKILTSQYDAGFGAQVPTTDLTTQSGANDFHADLWEFVRNDLFNANDFFRNEAHQSRPALKQNQFGGTMGGRVLKDRVFFFVSYQGTRQVDGLDSSALSTLILPPLTNDRTRLTIGAEFCPAVHGASYESFAGGQQVACDGANINPVALTLLQKTLPDGTYLIPTPQTLLTVGPNAGLGFSSFSVPSDYKEDQFLANSDYRISGANTLSERLYFATSREDRSLGAGDCCTGQVPGGPELQRNKDYLASLHLSSALTSNLANAARVTFTRNSSIAKGPGIPSAAAIGITPAAPLFPEPPAMTIEGPLGDFRFLGYTFNDSWNVQDTYSFADSLSFTKGANSLRAGVHVYMSSFGFENTGKSRGRITFENFTDFLLGMGAAQNGSPGGLSNIEQVQADEGYGPHGEVQFRNQTNDLAAYLQDDLKVTRSFTLSPGLRWEYLGTSYDTGGNTGTVWPQLMARVPVPPLAGTLVGDTVPSNYDPHTLNPLTGLPFGPPPPGVVVRSNRGEYQNRAPLDTFAPRFGFAWQPDIEDSRISIRGGYGWFYQTNNGIGNAPGTAPFAAAPFSQSFNNSGSSNALSTLQQPVPQATLGFIPRTPTTQLSDRVAGPVYKVALLQNWNLSVQYRFSSTVSLDVGYVGSQGDHLILGYGLNQPSLASAAHAVNCGYDGTPTHCITDNTEANAPLRVPFMGEAPTALGANQYIGVSWYHSLQATLRDTLSHGFSLQASYTYSKSESNLNILNDQNNLRQDWARAPFDRTHHLVLSYGYAVPAPATGGRLMRAAFENWSISGLLSIQGGDPLTLIDVSGGSVYGFAGAATVTLCPGASNRRLATFGRDQSRLNNWFNTPVICSAPIVGPDGSTGYGNAGQGVVTGPGQLNTDFSIQRLIHVGGIKDGQFAFRVEFYNAFNHPQFADPGTYFGTATFGTITQSSVAPRLIQFGLKYAF